MARIVASENGVIGFGVAQAILSGGGSALDAVEAATRVVEDTAEDHTVGYGGYPNLLGEVELDASIMDGSTRRAGAVGALRGYRYAITVARAIMERLPHVLVVGEGATRLAEELNMTAENLLTSEAEKTWRQGLDGKVIPGSLAARMLSQMASLTADPEHAAGTVNFLAQDQAGHIASAVSTSGWAWKYPGRLGDSPLIGAGNYADDRYGAAACTGWGELAIRASSARSVVWALKAGASLEEATLAAMRDLEELDVSKEENIVMHIVSLDSSGNHCGVTTRPGATYAFWEEGLDEVRLLPRTVVELES